MRQLSAEKTIPLMEVADLGKGFSSTTTMRFGASHSAPLSLFLIHKVRKIRKTTLRVIVGNITYVDNILMHDIQVYHILVYINEKRSGKLYTKLNCKSSLSEGHCGWL